MADARLPDDFYDLVAHHLPPEQPVGPKGGRPPIGHRFVLRASGKNEKVVSFGTRAAARFSGDHLQNPRRCCHETARYRRPVGPNPALAAAAATTPFSFFR